jgi:hypothetical protein
LDGRAKFWLFEFVEVLEHDVQIAKRAELAAKGFADAIKRPAASSGDDGFDEIGGGFQSAGDDTGVVDGIFIVAGEGGGHQLAKVLDEGIEVFQKGNFIVVALGHGGIILNRGGGFGELAVPRTAAK